MIEYEIRYLRQDGSTTFLWKVSCLSDLDARTKASGMIISGTSAIEIWRDGNRVLMYNA
jgi:hypothetical protein